MKQVLVSLALGFVLSSVSVQSQPEGKQYIIVASLLKLCKLYKVILPTMFIRPKEKITLFFSTFHFFLQGYAVNSLAI